MDYAWFLFRFEDRINRGKFWLAGLIILCWMIFGLIVVAAIGKIFGIASRSYAIDIFGMAASLRFANDVSALKASLFPQLLTLPMTVVFAWVYAATSIKRLHDRNKSSWWIVPFVVAPGLVGRFEDWLGDSYAAALLGLVVLVLGIWGFVEMGFLKGTPGPNRFGSDPLAPTDTRPHWDQQSELEMVPHSASPSPVPHVNRGHE